MWDWIDDVLDWGGDLVGDVGDWVDWGGDVISDTGTGLISGMSDLDWSDLVQIGQTGYGA